MRKGSHHSEETKRKLKFRRRARPAKMKKDSGWRGKGRDLDVPYLLEIFWRQITTLTYTYRLSIRKHPRRPRIILWKAIEARNDSDEVWLIEKGKSDTVVGAKNNAMSALAKYRRRPQARPSLQLTRSKF